jgi:hypothetical protein
VGETIVDVQRMLQHWRNRPGAGYCFPKSRQAAGGTSGAFVMDATGWTQRSCRVTGLLRGLGSDVGR